MTDTQLSHSQVRAILQWHLDVGVDETISQEAMDRFGLTAPSAKNAVPAPAQTPQAGATSSNPADNHNLPPAFRHTTRPKTDINNDALLRSAFERAAEATNISELRATLESFDGCALKKTAMNLVFVDGNEKARLLFIGEAPGAEEDRQGAPFVGPGGILLDKMLASIGFSRNEITTANTVFWRPPGNRTPTPQETVLCGPFIERLIELIDPDVLVTLGGPASKSLLGQTPGIGRLRGKWFTYSTARISHPIDTIPMYHPDSLIQTPAQKRASWQDLLAIKSRLDGKST